MKKCTLLLLSIPFVVAQASLAAQPQMKWQDYDQPGYSRATQKYSATAEMALTIRLQKMLADENTPITKIEDYLERLISICAFQNKYDAAEQYSEQALELAKTHKLPQTYRAHLHVIRGNLFAKEAKYTCSELEYSTAHGDLTVCNITPLTNNVTGQVTIDSADRNQTDRAITRGFAQVYTEEKRYGDAERFFDQLTAKIPDDSPRLSDQLKRFESIKDSEGDSLARDDHDLQRQDLVGYAKCLMGEGKYNEAQRKMLLALELDHNIDLAPSLAAEFNDLACILVKENQNDDAEACMQIAVKLCRKHQRTDLRDWLQNLAGVLNAEGKTVESKQIQLEADSFRHTQIGESESHKTL